MEAQEVCEWLEGVIEDLIEEYKWGRDNRDWTNGAIEALEKLLDILNDE